MATISSTNRIEITQTAADNGAVSELLMYVSPHYSTPKHYHNLFAETFQVLDGELELGAGRQRQTLKAGQRVVVEPGVVHYFKNNTANSAIVRVSISPGNTDFEDGFLIYHGLVRDNLVDKKENPKNFADVALFLYLTNSRFPGFGRLIEPVFRRTAQKHIRQGYLAKLMAAYSPKNRV